MDGVSTSGIPQQIQYNLTHYQQLYNWDCGISCILMILSSTRRKEFIDNFSTICEEEGFGTSTWSIDLCYILRRFNVRHEYYTKTLGIDPNYKQHSYYTKIIDKDELRVTKKFKEAKAYGLNVQQKTVHFQILINHLAKHGPVILLTNVSLLTCEICKPNLLEDFRCFQLSCFSQNSRCTVSYAGHYVVLCGYDLKLKRIYYRNPEVKDKHICYCSFNAIERARKAYGTDEDVILIFMK